MVYLKRCEMIHALRGQALVQSAVGRFQDSCQALQQALVLVDAEEQAAAKARARALLLGKATDKVRKSIQVERELGILSQHRMRMPVCSRRS